MEDTAVDAALGKHRWGRKRYKKREKSQEPTHAMSLLVPQGLNRVEPGGAGRWIQAEIGPGQAPMGAKTLQETREIPGTDACYEPTRTSGLEPGRAGRRGPLDTGRDRPWASTDGGENVTRNARNPRNRRML